MTDATIVNGTDSDNVDGMTADTETTVEAPSTEALAAVALADLTVTQWNDSRIGSLDRAVELWGDFESAATDWFASRKANRYATRRAAIATARMTGLVVDEKGNPIWSAQATVSAWRVLYQDRVKPLYVKLATDSGDPDAVSDFEKAVRRYIADRHLKRVVIAEYAMDHTNGLGAKPLSTVRGASPITTREALALLLADETPDSATLSALENAKWNADLAKATKPHYESQVVKTGANKGNRQRGYEGTWTSFNPPATESTGGGGGGDDHADSAGQATYKSAKDKLVKWPTSDHWNTTGSTEFVHEILTAFGVKYLASVKQVRGRKEVVESYREISKLTATLADYIEGAGKTDKPSKADVEKLFYSE